MAAGPLARASEDSPIGNRDMDGNAAADFRNDLRPITLHMFESPCDVSFGIHRNRTAYQLALPSVKPITISSLVEGFEVGYLEEIS
jgi:hypothetical protein